MSIGRSEKRKKPINYLEVYDRETGDFMGKVIDITTQGIGLFTEKPFQIKAPYQLKLVLPEKIKKHSEICFDAVCKWFRQYDRGLLMGSCAYGLEITNIYEQDLDLLNILINSAWFKDWHQIPDYKTIRDESDYPFK